MRLRDRVRKRAGNRCEYCGLLEKHSPVARLQIEHIVPLKHGGTSHFEGRLRYAPSLHGPARPARTGWDGRLLVSLERLTYMRVDSRIDHDSGRRPVIELSERQDT